MAASDFEAGKGKGGWWNWGDAKRALEWLFWAGHVTTAYRRASFERVYDVPDRVIPSSILNRPVPGEADAHRALIARAAKALGIATAGDLRDYFRLKPQPSLAAISDLVDEGTLIPLAVEGWKQNAYLHDDARRPTKIQGRALLAPFDPLIWERARAERLFAFRYRIEIYTPAARRVHGYYVLPFLLNGQLVARVDLKADRQANKLLVRGISLEPTAPSETITALNHELQMMAHWLSLDTVDRKV